jgi:ankyrin repeat protein
MKHILLTTIAAVLLVGTGLAGPIHDAVLDEDIDEVQRQLDAGVDVNEENSIGYTPLHYAAGVGRIDIVELLIKHGANINATDSVKGATPLDYAHWKGQLEAIETLKTHNAKRTYGDGGEGVDKGKEALMARLSFIRSPFGFTFNTIEGKTYRVESASNLKKWNKLREIKGTGKEERFIDMRKIYFQEHFYRVVVEN